MQVGYQAQVDKQLQQRTQRQQAFIGYHTQVAPIAIYARTTDSLENLNFEQSENYIPFQKRAHGLGCERLYVAQNVIQTFADKEKHKPISHILFIQKDTVYKAAAVSHDDAIAYLEEMENNTLPDGLKVALMTPQGNVYKNNAINLEVLTLDPWFHDVLTSVNLWNGKIYSVDRIESWIQKDPLEFRVVWETLSAHHVYGDQEFDTHTLDLIYKRLGLKKTLTHERRFKTTVKEQPLPNSNYPVEQPHLKLPPRIGPLRKKQTGAPPPLS